MTDTPTYDVNFHVHSVGAGSLSGHMNVSFDINGLPDPDYPSAYGANVKGASSVGGQLHTEFGDQNEGVIQKEPRSYEGRETVTRSVSVSEQDYNAIRDAVVGEVGQSYDYALSGLLSDDVPKTCAEFAQSVYAGTSQPGMVGDLFTTLDAITVQGPIWDFIPGFGIHNIYDSLFTTVLMDMLDPPPDTSRPASNGPADVSGITGFAHEEIAVAIGVSPDAPPPAGFNGTVTTLSNGNVVHSRGVYDLEGPESVVNPHDSNNDHSDQPRGGSEGFGGGASSGGGASGSSGQGVGGGANSSGSANSGGGSTVTDPKADVYSVDGPEVTKDRTPPELDPDYHGAQPILLDLDGNGIQITELSQSTHFVDATGDGLQNRSAWAGAGDAVLFYDPNNLNDIVEKSQYVFSEWDPTASSDIEALRAVFDSNGDGVLNDSDDAFDDFKLMVTHADGSTSVMTLDEAGITEIDLTGDATHIRNGERYALSMRQ